MNDEKQIMNIFAQAYLLLAKASKQEPSLEGFLQILEMLGEDGIQECAKVADLGPEAVALAMVQIIQLKQTLKAENGAKLKYVMQLLGKCLPGYLKKGGRCKPCELKEKMNLLYSGGDVKPKRNRVYGIYAQKEYNKLPFDLGFVYKGSAPHRDIFFHNNYYNLFNPETERLEIHSYDENFTPVSKDILGIAKSPLIGYNKAILLQNLIHKLGIRADDIFSEKEGGSIDKSKHETNMQSRRYSGGVFRNKADLMLNGGNTPSIRDYRKLNQKLKEKINLSDRTRTEGVRGKDGKLQGTKEFPRRLPELIVTNKTTKKKEEGGSLSNTYRYPYFGNREIYPIGGGKYMYYDRIYRNPDDLVEDNVRGDRALTGRNIYVYPDARNWRITKRDTTYIKGSNKEKFEKSLKGVSPKDRKKMLRTK